MANGNNMTQNTKHTTLFNETKFTTYSVPQAHALASVFNRKNSRKSYFPSMPVPNCFFVKPISSKALFTGGSKIRVSKFRGMYDFHQNNGLWAVRFFWWGGRFEKARLTKKIQTPPIVPLPPPHEHVTLPPAALPSFSKATSAMDPSHCTAIPMSPVQALGGASHSHRSPFPCFEHQKGTHQKIERWAGPWP